MALGVFSVLGKSESDYADCLTIHGLDFSYGQTVQSFSYVRTESTTEIATNQKKMRRACSYGWILAVTASLQASGSRTRYWIIFKELS